MVHVLRFVIFFYKKNWIEFLQGTSLASKQPPLLSQILCLKRSLTYWTTVCSLITLKKLLIIKIFSKNCISLVVFVHILQSFVTFHSVKTDRQNDIIRYVSNFIHLFTKMTMSIQYNITIGIRFGSSRNDTKICTK